MTHAREFLRDTARLALPRVLTHVCRDPGSPFYGCCDRNWWHYKVIDFPSIILQQAGYAIAVASQVDAGKPFSGELRLLASATCRFWNERAIRRGAFEEYYPNEQGYPPLAFSTLAVAKLCAEDIVTADDVEVGLRTAVRHLLARFEAEAANQQVAGTAALAVIRRVAPALVPEDRFQDLLTRTLALQTREGWFPEYDGPDLGYLSVAMDCLWDIYDATGDERCLAAIDSAFGYLSWFVLGPIGGAGMHNSRNTDYIVPYGLVRLACESNRLAGQAAQVVCRLYVPKADSPHFLDSVDDRYWCHYIGHSVFRAVKLLSVHRLADSSSPSETEKPCRFCMPESGHVLLQEHSARTAVLVSGRKGGIFTAVWPDGQSASDFGWIVDSKRDLLVSHWWSQAWVLDIRDGEVSCTGAMVRHKEHVSTTWKHLALRLASGIVGRRIMPILKRLMIFKRRTSRVRFSRTIRYDGAAVVAEDRIAGIRRDDRLTRAPRSSKRHVSSADSFHPEDLVHIQGVSISEERQQRDGEVLITTRYEVTGS